jgi:hypothetical protein
MQHHGQTVLAPIDLATGSSGPIDMKFDFQSNFLFLQTFRKSNLNEITVVDFTFYLAFVADIGSSQAMKHLYISNYIYKINTVPEML